MVCHNTDIRVRKKAAISVIVILAAGLIILGYFLQRNRKDLQTDPYRAIPTDACFIVETTDFQNFVNSITSNTGLTGELQKVKELREVYLKLNHIAGQLSKPGFGKLRGSGISLLSLHASESGKLKPFLVMTIPSDIRLRQMKEILYSLEIEKFTEIRLDGATVLGLPYVMNEKEDTLYIGAGSGLLLSSTSLALLRGGLAQQGRDSDIRSKPGFSRVLAASGKNENKIFIVFDNIGEVMKQVFGNIRPDLAEKATALAGSACGDIFLNENGLIISGFAEAARSSDILYRYRSVSPGTLKTYRFLPSSTALFETVITGGDIKPVSASGNGSGTISPLVSRIKDYIGDEVTRAWFNIGGRAADENTLVIYELNNRVMCEQVFIEMSGPSAQIIWFRPDDQTRIPVYQNSGSRLISYIYPAFARVFEEKYFAFYDNFMITGNSYLTVSRFLYDNLLNKTLANDTDYRDFESTLPSRAGYLFYCVPSNIIDYLSLSLDNDIIGGLKRNKATLDKIQAAGFQFASSNDMIYNSLSIRFKDEVREESSTEWETLLDTIASIKPFFFTNHNTGAKEIFVQDQKNNVYLINSAGRVLWKVPLGERITGNVYMIDYFRNGKYQLLFSGRDYLHLLDRNGNYVDRYPVKLRSPAASPLALFDYDNNRDYRLFIAGEDKLIYAYDRTGSAVKGWKPFRTTGRVTSEIVFFRVSGKDYIVAADDRALYFLDRTGNIRLRPKEAVTKAAGSTLRLSTGRTPSVVCSAPDGTIQHIGFDGEVTKYRLKEFTPGHNFDFFDVDGDSFGEYIFLDEGKLYLYNNNRTGMFTREFGSSALGGPINFIFSGSDRKIGVVDLNGKLIYLVNRNGEVMNGFPLRGASLFSIGRLSARNSWHLIVGGTDSFLYNYRLETY